MGEMQRPSTQTTPLLWLRLRDWLPHGRTLPAEDWRRRHRAILILLVAHSVGLLVFAVTKGETPLHAVLESSVIGLLAGAAALPVLPQRWRGAVAAVGLMTSSAILTHFSGGYIEAHFHFFIMMAVAALYEDWLPFLLSILYVAIHHGLLGTLEPASVYNHAGAITQPWLWAGIHAVFVLGMACALVLYWRSSERARQEKEAEFRRSEETRLEGLRRAQELAALKALNEARGEFVGLAAHELRTPLGPMKADLMLLREDGALSADHRESIDALGRNLERMSRFIEDLLQVARMQRGKFRMDVRSTQLDEVLLLAAESYRPVADAAGVTLETDRVDACTIPADPHRLEQVFMNLLANAVRATPAGGKVQVSLAVDAEARISFRDTGIGLRQQDIGRLFEPFSQITDGLGQQGTGLGLYICRSIVELHGGRIWCESEGPGKGAAFHLALPLVQVVASRGEPQTVRNP